MKAPGKVEKMIPPRIRVILQLVSWEGEFRGRVRMQKLVFLANEKYRGDLEYEFEPAPLGPVSSLVSDGIRHLQQLGLVEEKTESTGAGHTVFCYKITESGKKLIEVIKENDDDAKLSKAINSTYKKYGRLGYVDLLDVVHRKFPSYHLKHIRL